MIRQHLTVASLLTATIACGGEVSQPDDPSEGSTDDSSASTNEDSDDGETTSEFSGGSDSTSDSGDSGSTTDDEGSGGTDDGGDTTDDEGSGGTGGDPSVPVPEGVAECERFCKEVEPCYCFPPYSTDPAYLETYEEMCDLSFAACQSDCEKVVTPSNACFDLADTWLSCANGVSNICKTGFYLDRLGEECAEETTALSGCTDEN